MDTIRLIHWKAEEAEQRAAILTNLGYAVDFSPIANTSLRALWSKPPAVIIIDLTRIPSQGRDLGIIVRKRKATRFVPLIFVGGTTEVVARVQTLLPDAHFTTWKFLPDVIPDAIQHPPEDPVVPQSIMAAYAGTPLPKKLGVKSGSVIGLVGAPPDFHITLGELPPNASLQTVPDASWDITLWFVRTYEELAEGINHMLPFGRRGGLWIIWPKKSSNATGLSQKVVRKTGMDAGLVDYKIASIDQTWSGLRFTHKKQKPS